ncbi:cytochrome-c peroxidase [Emticicia sp. C21]|uniref:cytochrome-c peroxidase n=1 Tax=Emticicia sp. C21 TaxID=2302915 RepID=UPI001E4AD42B|nr:cytochrome c peroxidase [Emticicia sp. C21]
MALTRIEFTGFSTPVNFPAPVYDVVKNPVTADGFKLGRKLFYESALSRDNSISCGNCHIQAAGFTQHGHDVSHGVDDRLGNRNSPPIMNLAWSKSFMWDGGVFHLELFPISPITNPVEMDEKMENVLAKLKADKAYEELFYKAYGSKEITGNKVFNALTQFMLLCISSDSKYDSVMRETGVKFNEIEQKGYTLFKNKCSTCHQEPLFTDGTFRNNGLNNTYNPDIGRQAITLDANDQFKFKVPSLRNNAFTVPYMHDGRFTSLDQVLEHYSTGITNSPTLDPLLKQNGTPGLSLNAEQKMALKAFLNTLNDKHFITRKDLSENHEK